MKLKNINLIFKIISWYLISRLNLSFGRSELFKQDMKFIYSSIYSSKFDIANDDGAYTKIKATKNANLVFVSAGMEGILVLDAKTNNELKRIHLGSYVDTLESTSDGKYVFFSLNNIVCVASFESRSFMKILSSAYFPSNITDMILDNEESILYVGGVEGYLAAYDVRDKNKISQLCTIDTNSVSVESIKISSDNNWLILSNHYVGLQVLKISNNTNDDNQNSYKLNLILAAQGPALWKIVDAAITDQMDYIYSLDNWFGIFICKFDSISKVNQSQYPLKINQKNFWPFKTINPSTYCLQLIQNSRYLAVGLRSQGIFIFDIQDRENPMIYQIIPLAYNAFSIALSPSEDYIYYSVAESILIFQKVSLNLNDKYPNFFNVQQSLFQQTSSAYYKWRCYVRQFEQSQYFFGAFDLSGIIILNITDPYNYKHVFSQSYESTIVDSIAITQDNRYMIVPVQQNKTSVIVYDTSNLSNPEQAFRLDMEQINFNEVVFLSKNQKLMAMSFDDGALLLDSSQLPELYLLAYWKKFGYMIGECSSVIITNDNKFLIGAVREYGYFSLSINLDKKQNILEWQYTLKTLGGEGLIPSMYDDRYIYFYDGFKGVGVFDATKLPVLVILSRISLTGWSNVIIPIQQDNYLLVAQNESGLVSLVDATNKSDLHLVSQFLLQNGQSAQSLCLTLDQKYIFVNNNLGTLVMPLQSQIQLHTEFQLVTVNSSGYTNYTLLSNNQFEVGQQVKISFLMIYPIEGAQIVSVQYYLNSLVLDIPYWINFDQVNQNIFMKIDKQALGTQFNGKNLNIILLKTVIPIDDKDFVFILDDGTSTSENDSVEIFNYLRQQEIITQYNYLPKNFDHALDMKVSINGTLLPPALQKAIRQKLQRSIFVNQIMFQVSSSLILNLNKTNPISSLSQSVEIQFQVDTNTGRFVLKEFQGIILSMSAEQSQLILKGDIQSINNALQQKIILFSLLDPSQIYVTITLSDDINYSQSFVYKISECPIIREKITIKINESQKLQNQFNKKYSHGIVGIEQLFSIDFEMNSFIDEEKSQISLKAYIINGDEQQEILSDQWIQFRTNVGFFTFQGTPGSSQLFQKVCIRVIANDGYSSAWDEFCIYIEDIPLTYILNLLLQILGPLLALLKLYYSRYIFLNCIYKRKITFSSEKAMVGKPYFKKFILMGNDMHKCINLFQGFIQEERKQKKITSENKQKLKKDIFNQSNIFSPQINIQEDLQKLSQNNFDQKVKVERRQYQSHNSFLLRKYSKVISDQLIKAHNRTSIKNQIPLAINQFNQNIQQELDMEYVLDKIIKSQITFKIGGKKYSPELFQLDFKNQDSKIYRGLESLAARYYLKKDQRSYRVYKYLKLYSMEYSRYNKNDWYKYYVSIIPNSKKDIYGIQVPFPSLNLQEQAVNIALQKLDPNISFSIELTKNFGINFDLIRTVLYYDTLGLVNYIPDSLQPCIGISIHLHSYQIKAVQSYKLVNDSRFLYLRKLLNIDYNEYGASKNRSLPNWLELEHNNGVIQLTGTPMSQDAETILLRIINSKDFVVQQFSLNISQQKIDLSFIPQITQPDHFNSNNQNTMFDSNSFKFDFLKNQSIFQKNTEKSGFRKQQQIFNFNLNSESPISQIQNQFTLPVDIKDEASLSNTEHLFDQNLSPSRKSIFSQVINNSQSNQNICKQQQIKQNEIRQSQDSNLDKIDYSISQNDQNLQNVNQQSTYQNENQDISLTKTDFNYQNEDVNIHDIRQFKFYNQNNIKKLKNKNTNPMHKN